MDYINPPPRKNAWHSMAYLCFFSSFFFLIAYAITTQIHFLKTAGACMFLGIAIRVCNPVTHEIEPTDRKSRNMGTK